MIVNEQTTSTYLPDQGVNSENVNHPQDTISKLGKKCMKEINHEYMFRFPEKSMMKLNTGETIDVSNIELDLSEIFIGGIGYGGGPAKLMSRAMRDIGHGGNVYNLPFCIEGCLFDDFRLVEVSSTEDKKVSESTISDIINEFIKKGYTNFNIPVNINNHTSLATIIVSNGMATLRFYDSLSSTIQPYEIRYNRELLTFMKSLLPKSITLTNENSPEILHLLDQGDENSTGCGYFSLFTALLLKEDEKVRKLTSNDMVAPLFTQIDDKAIRADLVVRTLLTQGLENVNVSRNFLESHPREAIHNKIGFEVIKLKNQLLPRINRIE